MKRALAGSLLLILAVVGDMGQVSNPVIFLGEAMTGFPTAAVPYNNGGITGGSSLFRFQASASSSSALLSHVNVGSAVGSLSAYAQSYLIPFVSDGSPHAGANTQLLAVGLDEYVYANTGTILGITELTSAANGGTPGGVPAGVFGVGFLSGFTTATRNHTDTRGGDFDVVVTDATDYRAGGGGYISAITAYGENSNGGKLTRLAGLSILTLDPGDTDQVYGIHIGAFSGFGNLSTAAIKLDAQGGAAVSIDADDPAFLHGGVIIGDAAALRTDTTTAHTAVFQAYDVDGATYRTFATLTNANTPTFDISAPSGGSLSGNFTTLQVGGTNVVTNGSALTANLPVIGGGGSAIAVGTRSGNTTQYVTTTGTLTSGDCVKIDASGNFIANGSSCSGGGANTALSNLASVAINTTLLPASNDGAALGSGTLSFSDLFLASGGVINLNNGNVTVTHAAGVLTVGGSATNGINLTLAAGGTSRASLTFPVSTLTTTANAGDFEVDATNFYGTTDAGNRGIIPIVHFIRQHADRAAFATGTGQQAIFDSVANGTLTLETGTYEVEGVVQIKGMSGTSGNLKFSLNNGGGASLANILYVTYAHDAAVDAAVNPAMVTEIQLTQTVQIANATTATVCTIYIKGTFEVSGAGSIIPSVAQNTSVSTAVTTAGSYMKFTRMGTASVVSVGQWT